MGAASLFVVSTAASASGVEGRARASIVYRIVVLLVLEDLVLLFIDLKDGLMASFSSGAGQQFQIPLC